MDIRGMVRRLCRKYETHDPFALADCLGVIVIFAPLSDSVRGFYRYVQRRKLIFINADLPEEVQRIVCAHELGHCVMHRGLNKIFLDRHTFLITDRFEVEANRFAADLLINDDDVETYRELSVGQLEMLTGFDEDSIRYRFQR